MKYHRILSTTIVSLTATATIRRIVLATSIGVSSNNSITSAFVELSQSGRISQPRSMSSDTTTTTTTRTTDVDPNYPGTAVERLQNVHRRVAELVQTVPPVLNGPWESVRQQILWAGGLRDLPNASPGQVRFLPNFNTNFVSFSRLIYSNLFRRSNPRVIQGIPSMTSITWI